MWKIVRRSSGVRWEEVMLIVGWRYRENARFKDTPRWIFDIPPSICYYRCIMIKTQLRISEELHELLRSEAHKQKCSMNRMIVDSIEMHLLPMMEIRKRRGVSNVQT
jgi:hypothetical protein